MPTSIDELQIEINAKAVKANDAIDRLVGKLNGLTTSLGNLNPSSLNNLANGVHTLGTAMQTMKDVKKTDFNKMARGINAFGKIDIAKLSSISTTLAPLATSIESLGAVKLDNKSVQNLINSLTRLSNANLNSLSKVNFSKFGNSINKLSVSLSNAPKIQQSVISLTNSIANLSKHSDNIPIVATSLGNLGNSLSKFMSVMASAPSVTDSTVIFTQAITSLASTGAKAGLTASSLGVLGAQLKNLMTTLSTAPVVSQNVIDMTNALANLSTQGSKVGSASRSIQRSLNGTATSTARAKKGFNGLASAIGKFYASYFLVIRGIKGLWSSINTTADYIEAFNYYTVSFGKIASKWDENWENYGSENAQNYSNSFVTTMNDSFKKLSGVSYDPQTGLLSETGLKNLGLNLQEVTQYAAQLGSMMDAVGHSGEVTLATTNAFVKLAGDISSLYNIDYSEASSKIRSVLQGQSRAGYGFGWDTTMASLQATADELNLSKAVSEMSQMEKQQLRILTILNQSRVAYGDQSNTINTLANQLRLLKNNIKEASMVLGQLFVPILSKLIPVINGTTIAIKRLMGNLASIFGIKIEDTGQGFTDMEDDAENLEDTYDDLAESIKAAKNQLLGFDEVNKLQEPSATATVDAEMGGIDLTDEILKATDEYQKIWQEAFDKMEANSNKWADKIEKAISGIGDVFEDFTLGEYFKAGEDVSQLVIDLNNFIAKAIRNVDWKGIGDDVGLFLKGIKWTEVFLSLLDVLDAALDGLWDAWYASFEESPLETSLITAIAAMNTTLVANALMSKLSTVSSASMPLKIGVYLMVTVIGVQVAEEVGTIISEAFLGSYDPWAHINEEGEHSKKVQEIADRYANLNEKVEKYIELSKNYENLTEEEKGYVYQMGQELQNAGIVDGINAITGAWEGTTAELKKAIEYQSILAQMSVTDQRIADLEYQREDAYNKYMAANREFLNTPFYEKLAPVTYARKWSKVEDARKEYEAALEVLERAKLDKKNLENRVDKIINADKKVIEGVSEEVQKQWGSIIYGDGKYEGLTSINNVGFTPNVDITEEQQKQLDALLFKHEAVDEEIESNPTKVNINTSNFVNGVNYVTTFFNGFAGLVNATKLTPELSNNSIISKITEISNKFNAEKKNIEDKKIKPSVDTTDADTKTKTFFKDLGEKYSIFKTTVKVEEDTKSVADVAKAIAAKMETIKVAMELKNVGNQIMGVFTSVAQSFATGGFPEDGLFFANHNELVGQFSNGKTAVANNEQITQGIAQAVAPAVYEAVVSAMQSTQRANSDVVVNIDGKQVFKAVQRQANDYTAQTGLTPFNI